MDKKVKQFLGHPENRINLCKLNALLWNVKEDERMAGLARADLYRWVGIAQENNEQHF